ncbi:hypothetical protein [Actinoplanes siamensis]|uniref:hypothetical protein n=1 Tax=Actinoplanes siamensis TaxID=1223317 RepID=UPI0019439070|nr:hypothetical protein [Actinoplanes siamensis]
MATFDLRWHGAEAVFQSAKRDLHRRAAELSSRVYVAHAAYLESELNLLLDRQWVRRFDGDMSIVGADVELEVSPDVLAAYNEMQAIRRQAAVERLRWETDLVELEFLREQVFSRPEVARSYWLKHHLDKPGDFAAVPFDQIAESFAADRGPDTPTRIAEIIGDFLGRLDEGQRDYLIGQLGRVFSSYSRPDLAERLNEARLD